MTSEAVLFVFYTLLKSSSWTYGTFPKGWSWTGSGSTSSIKNTSKLKYEREEQFNGTKHNQDKMQVYLKKYFDKLKQNGIVKFYKIRKSYKP
jgi:hypothetical protein